MNDKKDLSVAEDEAEDVSLRTKSSDQVSETHLHLLLLRVLWLAEYLDAIFPCNC